MNKKDYTINANHANSTAAAIAISTADKKKKAEMPKSDRPRINLALDPDNYEYVKIIARVSNTTITAYINDLIALDMQEPDKKAIFKSMKKFRDKNIQ